MTGNGNEIVPIIFVIPPGRVGFVASPGEFARAEQTHARFGAFASADVLPVGDGRRELRLFTLPGGVALNANLTRVPGFNIVILREGQQLELRVTRSALPPGTET